MDTTYILTVTTKISLLIGGSLLLVLALCKTEPRWRVLVLRAALFSLPVVVVAGAISPALQLPFALPGNSGMGNDASTASAGALPTVLVATKVDGASAGVGREMIKPETFPSDRAVGLSLALWHGVVGIWLLGVLVLLFREQLLKRRVAVELQAAADGDVSLQAEWQAVCREFGLEAVPGLKVGRENSSPFLVGGKHPLLLIPQSLVEDGSTDLRRHVFRHEVAHLAAQDLPWLAALRLLTRLFWPQPLLWLLEAKHLEACEEAADAEAARRGGTRQYRGALASLALELVPTGRAIPTVAFFRGPSVVRRLRAVAHHGELRPPSRWRSLVVVAVIVITGAVLGNTGMAGRGASSSIDLQMAELSYEGYLESKAKGANEKAAEYLKMAIDYLPKSPRLDGQRAEWTKELDRVAFPQQVTDGWERDADGEEGGDEATGQREAVGQALRKIVIPRVDFRDTPLSEAVDILYRRAEDSNAAGELPFRFELDADDYLKEAAITLRLTNVPLTEALRYTTSLARLQFMIEVRKDGNIIRIFPLAQPDDPLLTTVHDVIGIREFEEDGADAKQILMNAGIVFPEKASAILNATRGQLIVRNIRSQMELVKAWLDDARQRAADPSNIWYRAYTTMKAAEALRDIGKVAEALSKFAEAKRMFESLQQSHPEFHSELVRFRNNKLDEQINALREQSERRGPVVVDTPPHLVPNHPVQLPKQSDADGDDEAVAPLLPVVPVHPSGPADKLRDELAPPVVQLQGVNADWATAKDGGQLRTLSVQVGAGSGVSEMIAANRMSLVVKFYDRVGTSKLKIGVGETEIRYPSAPYDWSDGTEGETVEVEYHLPKARMVDGQREYFGYVAELYYDDVLQGVMASPSKLLRLVE